MKSVVLYLKKNQRYAIFAVIIMVLSLPFIVDQIIKRQDVRQRAQTAPTISFSLSSSAKNIAANDEVSVDLIMNAGSSDIGALDFRINYPSNILQLVSDTPLSSYTVVDKQTNNGSYKVTLLNITSTPITGDGIKVVTLKFKALADGTAEIRLDPGALEITASGSNQFVNVSSPDNISESIIVGNIGEATLSLSPSSGTITAQSDFSIQVLVNSSAEVNAVRANISYPQSALELISVTKGDFGVDADQTNSPGVIELNYGSTSPLSGVKVVATLKFRARADTTANLSFSDSVVVSSVTNQNILSSSTGGNYTVRESIAPTATSTPIPSKAPTPTNTPVPTKIADPTETPEIPLNRAGVKISVALPGIGLGVGDNSDPKTTTRDAQVQVLNTQGTVISTVNGEVTYNPENGRFEGVINLGQGVGSGSYEIKVKVGTTLTKQIDSVSLSLGTAVTTNPLTMVSGDLQDKNTLDITDWTTMVACIRNESGCTQERKSLSDLNDDGVLDVKDATIMQRGFLVVEGD